MNIIQINNLTKHFKVLNRHEGLLGAAKDLFSQDYKIVKAVDGISMQIAEGETIGFVGPNGAGKSTTIKMMTGVLEPSGGEININGYIPYKERKNMFKTLELYSAKGPSFGGSFPLLNPSRYSRKYTG